MSILSQNLKMIRREVLCTQTEMAQALGVGFRTYVRYESGERDAPAGTLILISKIGNISLQNLLTRQLEKHDVVPGMSASSKAAVLSVKSFDPAEGTIVFEKMAGRKPVARNDAERILLARFRKLDNEGRKEFIRYLKKNFKARSGQEKKAGKPVSKNKALPDQDLVTAASIKPGRIRKRGQGAKTLDQKTLREKIRQLKSISRSAPKVTVR